MHRSSISGSNRTPDDKLQDMASNAPDEESQRDQEAALSSQHAPRQPPIHSVFTKPQRKVIVLAVSLGAIFSPMSSMSPRDDVLFKLAKACLYQPKDFEGYFPSNPHAALF